VNTLNIPLQMTGQYSGGVKAWDQLFKSLSDNDQEEYTTNVEKNLRAHANGTWDKEIRAEIERRLRPLIPDFDFEKVNSGQRKLTPLEEKLTEKAVKEFFLESILKAIDDSRLSTEGKSSLKSYFRKHMG